MWRCEIQSVEDQEQEKLTKWHLRTLYLNLELSGAAASDRIDEGLAVDNINIGAQETNTIYNQGKAGRQTASYIHEWVSGWLSGALILRILEENESITYC